MGGNSVLLLLQEEVFFISAQCEEGFIFISTTFLSYPLTLFNVTLHIRRSVGPQTVNKLKMEPKPLNRPLVAGSSIGPKHHPH